MGDFYFLLYTPFNFGGGYEEGIGRVGEGGGRKEGRREGRKEGGKGGRSQ